MDTTQTTAQTTPAGPTDGPSPEGIGITAAQPAARPRFTLRRSRNDVMLGGVCGGLADELDLDPALIRIAMVALTLFTGGAAALVYLVAWILVPVEDVAA